MAVAVSAVWPGLGHFGHRNRRALLLATATLAVAVVGLVYSLTRDMRTLLTWSVNRPSLQALIVATLCVLVFRCVVAFDAYRTAARRYPPPRSSILRRLGTLVTLMVLALLIAAPHLIVVRLAADQLTLLSDVFDATDTQTARPTPIPTTAAPTPDPNTTTPTPDPNTTTPTPDPTTTTPTPDPNTTAPTPDPNTTTPTPDPTTAAPTPDPNTTTPTPDPTTAAPTPDPNTTTPTPDPTTAAPTPDPNTTTPTPIPTTAAPTPDPNTTTPAPDPATSLPTLAPATTAQTTTGSTVRTATWDGADRLTIALLGSDAGFGRYGVRTDTIIVLSIAVATGDAAAFNVPRNWSRVTFPEGTAAARRWPDGYPGIANEIYGLGLRHPDAFPDVEDKAGHAIKSALAQLTGLDIQYYVMVDMVGFVKVIDLFGGIDVHVSESINDRIQPIVAGGPPIDIVVEPGDYHFDGLTALGYVRSRIQSSDWHRMTRQRCVIEALIDQVAPLEAVYSYPTLTDIISQHMSTDIPANRLRDLVAVADRLDTSRIVTVNFIPPEFRSGNAPIPQVREAVTRALEGRTNAANAFLADSCKGGK